MCLKPKYTIMRIAASITLREPLTPIESVSLP